MNTKVNIKPRVHIGTLFVVLFSVALAITAITEVTITTSVNKKCGLLEDN